MSDALSVYDISTTYANLDANIPWFFFWGGMALVFNYYYFGKGIQLGFKYKIVTIPIACTMLFVVHDFIYLLMFDKWFNVYDHWFSKLYWVGLIITNIMEFLYFYLAYKYGRKEIMPQVSQKTYQIYMLMALAAAAGGFWCVKTVLADELWLFTFGFLVWLCLPFVIPTMLRRNSSLGQTIGMWISYMGMAVCYWMAVWPLDPFFQSPQWIAVLGMIIIWACVILNLIKKMPATEDFANIRDS